MQRLPNVHPSDTTKWPTGLGTFDVGAANEGSKILMYNESPLNLQLDFLNGSTDTLHAWEANWWLLDGDTKQIQWNIDNDSLSVTSPPIDAVFLTLWGPNEKIPGTYPVSLVRTVGGNVTTQQSQTLTNTGNASGSNVVTVGSTAASGNSWDVTNDGLWDISVTIAGLLVRILHTAETDPLLQLGATGHTLEVLGQLLVDQVANFTGTLNANGGINTNTIREDTNGNTAADLSGGVGNVDFKHNVTIDGTLLQTGIATFTAAPLLTAKRLYDGSSNNLVDWQAAGCFIKGNPSNNGPLQYYADGTNLDWRYFARSAFSGTGSVTVNHGLKYKGAGLTPQVINITQGVNAAGSQTQGCNTTGATQTSVVSGNAAAWTAIASSS